MKGWKLTVLALVLVVLFANVQANTQLDPFAYKAFTDFQGKKYSLNDVRGKGKWLIVMIWRNDCHVCNKEVAQYMSFHAKNKKDLATVVGISVDGPKGKKKAMSFIKRHKVNFPNLLVNQNIFSSLYKAISGKKFLGTPTIMIFARNGQFMGQQPGAIPSAIIEKFVKDNEKSSSK